MWKALSVIAALLVAVAATFSFLNKGDFEKERNLADTAKRNLEEINGQYAKVKSEQSRFTGKQEKMEERRETALAEQAAEKQKLDEKKKEVVDTQARIKELTDEIEAAKEKIAEFGNIEQLVALIDQLQADLFTAKEGIAALETQLASAQSRETQTAEKIQTYKDLEFRQRNGQMVSINASIASVYNTWGFVVLGAGDRQGVVSKTKLDVKRGGDKIAELVVTNLEKNRSVCDIVPGSMEPGQMLRPGDLVSVSSDSLPKPKAEPDPNAVPSVVPPGGVAPGAPVAPAVAPGTATDPDDPFADFTTPTTPDEPAPDATTPDAPKPEADPADPFGDL